jgi:hypothetical protein
VVFKKNRRAGHFHGNWRKTLVPNGLSESDREARLTLAYRLKRMMNVLGGAALRLGLAT